MEKYLITDKLGSGSYGVVYRAIEKISGEVVAIKQLKHQYVTSQQCMNEREVKFLSKLHHPNIIKLRGVILECNTLYLVFDYMECNLAQLIDQRGRRPFSETEIKNWCFQLFRGLAHMHWLGYFHRDLKPDNLLINGTRDVVKIADFGLAIEIHPGPPYTHKVGSRWYWAPEVMLMSGRYCLKVDMWAMGAIMGELFNRVPLFRGSTEFDQIFKICQVMGSPSVDTWPEGIDRANAINYKFPEFNAAASLSERIPLASQEAINLIGSLLCWDPCKRPTALEALQHPFFSSCYTITTPPQWSFIRSVESEKKIASSTTDKQSLVDYKEANELLKGSEIYVPPAGGVRRTDCGVIGRRKKQTPEEPLAKFAS